MGLAFSIVFVLFIIPVVLGVYFFFKKRKLGIILLCIPALVTVVIVGWWVYELNHHFVSSTDLTSETIDGISFRDDLDIEALTGKYGTYEKRDNVYFSDMFQFDNIDIGVNHEEKIIYVRTGDGALQTSRGISVTDHIEDVFEAYGDNYYKYSEMGRDDSLNYVDRDQKLHMQFWYQKDRVVRISFTQM